MTNRNRPAITPPVFANDRMPGHAQARPHHRCRPSRRAAERARRHHHRRQGQAGRDDRPHRRGRDRSLQLRQPAMDPATRRRRGPLRPARGREARSHFVLGPGPERTRAQRGAGGQRACRLPAHRQGLRVHRRKRDIQQAQHERDHRRNTGPFRTRRPRSPPGRHGRSRLHLVRRRLPVRGSDRAGPGRRRRNPSARSGRRGRTGPGGHDRGRDARFHRRHDRRRPHDAGRARVHRDHHRASARHLRPRVRVR